MPVTGAGSLRSLLIFSERVDANDGAGNYQETWIKRLTRRGQITPSRGSETVEAERLEGRGLVNIRIRNDSDTRKITADWKATDGVSGREYNIRSSRDPEQGGPSHGQWLDLTAEHGRALG